MLKKIKHLATEQAQKIIRDPAHASRAALASVLALGIFSLSLNLSGQIMPELFGARLVDSVTQADLDAAAAVKNASDVAVINRATSCSATRTSKDYEALIGNFEKSMSGILPGAGDLIASYPAIVSERKDQIALEVLKKYASLKFCIPEEAFETIYLGNYSELGLYLNPYMQVRMNEIGDDKYALGEIHSVPSNLVADEYPLAKKDLLMTEQQIIDAIDKAINSATELDKKTNEKINQLTSVTANRLAMNTNTALQKLGEIGNQSNLINASISGLTADVRTLLTIDETIPSFVLFGGSYTRVPSMALTKEQIGIMKGHAAIDSSDISLDLPGLPVVGSKIAGEINRLTQTGEISYGLLNLFRVGDRAIVAEGLGSAVARYAGAKLNLDPATPGSEDMVTIAAGNFALFLLAQIDVAEEQFCYAIDPEPDQEDRPCFGFDPEGSLLGE